MSSHSLIPIKKKRGRKRKSLFPQQIGYQPKIQPYQTSNKPISHFIKIPNNPDIQYAFHKICDLVENMLDNAAQLLQSNGVKCQNKQHHSSIMKLILPADMLAYIYHVQNNKDFKREALNIMQPGKAWNNKDKQKFDQNNDSNNYDDNQSKYNYSSKNRQHNQEENQEQNSKINYNRQYSQDDEEMELSQMNSSKSYGKNSLQKRKRRTKNAFFDLQLQKQLCDWVKNQANLGDPLTVDEFIKHAKYLAKHRSFSASTSWCRRFFDRYPSVRELLSRNISQPMQMKKVTFNFASQINDKNQISFSQKVRQTETHQLQIQNSQDNESLREISHHSESDGNIQDEPNIYAQPRKKKKNNEISQLVKQKLTQQLRQIYSQTKPQKINISNRQSKVPLYNKAKDIYLGIEQNNEQNSMSD